VKPSQPRIFAVAKSVASNLASRTSGLGGRGAVLELLPEARHPKLGTAGAADGLCLPDGGVDECHVKLLEVRVMAWIVGVSIPFRQHKTEVQATSIYELKLDLKTPAARGFRSLSVNHEKRKIQYFQRLEYIRGNRWSTSGVF
jgi:hypothetical protein